MQMMSLRRFMRWFIHGDVSNFTTKVEKFLTINDWHYHGRWSLAKFMGIGIAIGLYYIGLIIPFVSFSILALVADEKEEKVKRK